DDGRGGPLRADALDDLQPGHARHHHVEEDGVEGALLERREAPRTVASVREVDLVFAEVLAEEIVEPRVVVDEQDPVGHGGLESGAPGAEAPSSATVAMKG